MLKQQITDDMKAAMRAKDKVRLGTLRMLRADLLQREKDGSNAEITDDDVVQIIQKQVKQRRDAASQFEEADREDLAQSERAELAILEEYLPAQLSDEEIEAAVREVVAQTGASSMADMGRVMGPSMGRLKGQADGNRVREAVERILKG